ncbi:hypothetical protein A5648_14965 [Mycolicibacter sinensis]|uniref:Uncharacterized protein n=1 Tax=Mycolicibacter sinensis (strain JDM601) TaxID=875328 RepID=A0A1A3U8C5_MYCSD|nr:hypothetical protein [Mycobacterium sp. CSUR Q5927]OBK91156.1 hypothetical protein A5648_14965 [Mycolicibacter sinensis]
MTLEGPWTARLWLSTALRGASVGSVGLSVTLWIRAKSVDQAERGNAERRALFVGLWPQFLWVAADTVAGPQRFGVDG